MAFCSNSHNMDYLLWPCYLTPKLYLSDREWGASDRKSILQILTKQQQSFLNKNNWT